ncbi:MAG: DUF2156 domain-containing protein [Rhizobiaceae bacterium]
MHDIAMEDRHALLRHHGDFALAYSVATQPELSRFGDSRGFIAYRMVGGTALVLADPLAPPADQDRLLDAFIAEKRDVCFWQASRGLAERLATRGFLVNDMGRETIVDMSTFDFAGPHRRSYRTAFNRLAARGASVREASATAFDPQALARISAGWRGTRTTKRRELQFLVRPVTLADEPGVRKFFAVDKHGNPEGLAFFDPVYADGQVIGYLSATRRWLPSADPLTAYAMVRTAIERFKAEGVPSLYLGLSPFDIGADRDFTNNWLARRVFRLAFTNGAINRLIYPFQTLAAHKASFGGTARPTYYAFNTLPSLPRILKLIRACRIV